MKSFLLSVVWLAAVITDAAPPNPRELHAWYCSDGVQATGPRISSWNNSAASGQGRSLSRVVGKPRAVLVATPCGERTIVRFDGKSALWQPAQGWGNLGGERTVVAFVRPSAKAEGFLFDGSTQAGLSRAHLQDGKWHVDVQAQPKPDDAPADGPGHEAKPDAWQVHAFVFKRSSDGTDMCHVVDGKEVTVKAAADHPLAGFILGANVATEKGLACDVAEVMVFDRALAMNDIREAAKYLEAKWGTPTELPAVRQPKFAQVPEDPRVFRTVVRKQGDDGVHTYRIPGLVTTNHGTLIAVFDIRHKHAGDLPADIDVGAMRSTDNGETWSAMQKVMDYDSAEPGSQGNGVGDPTILVDSKTGTVFVAALWSKGARAWAGSGPGLTPDETGQFVICKSTDDGVTWSKPVSITPQIKNPAWRICFNGPGNGIQLRDGTLVFPAQFKGADNVPHSCFVASSDAGETWKISPAAIPGQPQTSEAQIAELENGALLLSMRNERPAGQRAWARWDWEGNLLSGNWSEHWLAVTDPTCMASLLRHPHGGLLSSNPNDSRRRIRMTIRSSSDDAKTWSAGKLLDPRPSAYSCMTVLKDGRVGILYEVGDVDAAETLSFARFPLDWALEPQTSHRNPATIPLPRSDDWWLPRHQERLAITRRGNIDLVFLGDSITQGWETHGKDIWEQFYSRRSAANYGFSGDHTQHVLWRLCNGELDGISPKAIVLMIGTNNTGGDSSTAEQTVEGVRAIIDKLTVKCPESKVLLLAIFPRGTNPADPRRQRNERINAQLPSLADGKRVHFLNINDKFLQPDGTLAQEIMPDYLHPHAKGYAVWAEAMEPKLRELLGEP